MPAATAAAAPAPATRKPAAPPPHARHLAWPRHRCHSRRRGQVQPAGGKARLPTCRKAGRWTPGSPRAPGRAATPATRQGGEAPDRNAVGARLAPTAAATPTAPKTASTASPGHVRRTASRPAAIAATRSTASTPVSSASLSWEPKCAIANSLTGTGVRLMATSPTATTGAPFGPADRGRPAGLIAQRRGPRQVVRSPTDPASPASSDRVQRSLVVTVSDSRRR